MDEIISAIRKAVRNELNAVLIEHEARKKENLPSKVFTINHVAHTLGLAHATVKKYVKNGLIKTTKSGLITEDAINNFLKG